MAESEAELREAVARDLIRHQLRNEPLPWLAGPVFEEWLAKHSLDEQDLALADAAIASVRAHDPERGGTTRREGKPGC